MKDIRQQCVDEQDKAAQIFTWCMVVAMHQEEGIGATRLTRACNEMRAFQARYKSKIDSGNRRKATEAMRDVLRGICDFTVRLPQIALRVIIGKNGFAWRRTRAPKSHGWLWPRRRI